MIDGLMASECIFPMGGAPSFWVSLSWLWTALTQSWNLPPCNFYPLVLVLSLELHRLSSLWQPLRFLKILVILRLHFFRPHIPNFQMPQFPLNMLYYVSVTPRMECSRQKSVFQMESDQCGVWPKYQLWLLPLILLDFQDSHESLTAQIEFSLH